VPVILITYATTEDAVRRAFAGRAAGRVITGAPQVIRIEKTRGPVRAPAIVSLGS